MMRISLLSASLLFLACGDAAPAPVTPTTQGGGPLALSASRGKPETFTFEDGQKPMLTFEAERVRVSASCAKPDGSLDCDAMRALRKGKQVKLGPEATGANPGAIACKKLGFRNTTGRAASGNEDGFCIFADGSMASTGALDMYVTE